MSWCPGSGVPDDPLCGGHDVPPEWDSVAWRKNTAQGSRLGAYTWQGTRPRCRLCEQTRRDWQKNLNRNRAKARTTIGSHSQRYAAAEKWACSVAEARRRLVVYGWTVDVIAELFEVAETRGICDGCGWEWDHGEHEMTLDVENPDALPLVPSNVAVVCRTCNNRKRAMSAADWRAFRAYAEAMRAGLASYQPQLF